MINQILSVDSYKHSHFKQYPPGTTKIYSYIESRGGDFEKLNFAGVQPWIKKQLRRVPTLDEINFAEKITTAHGLPFNRAGWIALNNLGYWPLRIQALPEGLWVKPGVPVVTIENTHDDFAWLVSFMETSLLRAVWYMSTVSTISGTAKKIIRKYLEETCDTPDWEKNILPFRLHDFGARGVSSGESAGLGGFAHLIHFMGSDTMEALMVAMEYYNADGPIGYSIPAAEHSTITSWRGITENLGVPANGEVSAYMNMINQFGEVENGLYAVVSDSYDLYHAVDFIWGEMLKDDVLNAKATLVVRPDSGIPEKIVVETLNMLGARFGWTINSKGYTVLNPKVRVIQGDGVNLKSIPIILQAVKDAGWSTENLALGMGGMLLQGCNRDTLKWAMKTSWTERNGKGYEVFKDPKTDPGKASKRGRFAVVTENGEFVVKPESGFIHQSWLRPIFENKLLIDHNVDDLRSRAEGIMIDMRKAAC